MTEPAEAPPACDRAETARWCSGNNVRRVRLVSAMEPGRIEHNGPALWMCGSCRAMHGWRVALVAD